MIYLAYIVMLTFQQAPGSLQSPSGISKRCSWISNSAAGPLLMIWPAPCTAHALLNWHRLFWLVSLHDRNH